MVGLCRRLGVHMFSHGCWAGLGLQRGFSGGGHAAFNEGVFFLSFFFFWKENFCLPILTVMVALQVLLSALFLCDDSRPVNMLRSLISNPAKTTSHTCMASPPLPSFTLPSETLAPRVPMKPDNPVLLSRNQKSPCGFVTVGTRATLLQITKSV